MQIHNPGKKRDNGASNCSYNNYNVIIIYRNQEPSILGVAQQ